MKTAGELRPGDVWVENPRYRIAQAYRVLRVEPGLARTTVRVVVELLPQRYRRTLNLFRENLVHDSGASAANDTDRLLDVARVRAHQITKLVKIHDAMVRPARNLAIVESVKGGAPLCAVAREFGLTRQHVWLICHRAGVETPRRPRQRDATKVQRDREIVERVRAGDSLVAVARAFGLTHVRVLVICERDGVRSRYRSLMVERRTQRAAIGPPDDWRVK
jgi:transposase-like protein